MLEKIQFNSRTTEVAACTDRMGIAFKKTTLSSDAFLTGMFSELETLSNDLSSSINRTKSESVLEEKDNQRDDKLRQLVFLIKGATYNPDPVIQKAALAVNKVIEKYGLSIASENYATETALLKSLLTDLAAAILQESIAAISGCKPLIAGLQTAQDDFVNTQLEYEENKASDSNYDSATTLRLNTMKLFNNKIVIYLNAMEMVAPETYSGFIATLNEILEDNNTTVKRRLKKPIKKE